MRKSILNLLGGAFFGLLTLTFTACGNIDNPLEVISNTNPATAFALKNILEKNSTFVVNFTLNDVDCTVTIVNDGDNGFVIESSEGVDLNLFDFYLTNDKKQVILTCYNSAPGGDRGDPFSQIFFNLQDESYYLVNGLGADLTFDGKASVNGVSGSLTNSCPDKATIEISFSAVVLASTRAALGGNLVIYYNKEKGETWNDVVDRYTNSAFDDLFNLYGDDNKIKLFVELYSDDYSGDVKYDDGETIVTSADVVGKKAGAAYGSNYKANMSVLAPA